MARRGSDDGEVGAPLDDAGPVDAPRAGDEADRRRGWDVGEHPHQPGDECNGTGVVVAEVDLVGSTVGRVAEPVDRGESRDGAPVDHPPAPREDDAAARAFEEVRAESRLERLDLPAQRGLRDVEVGGSLAEARVLSDRDEIAQLARLHEAASPALTGDAKSSRG